jgi:hypothetical protein
MTQLPLFTENGNGRMTKDAAGLKETPPGAERLLAELIKRGLPPGDLKVAASLCLALDERAGE